MRNPKIPKQVTQEDNKLRHGFSAVARKTDGFPFHWHEFYELEYIVAGKGENILNGTTYPIGAGDFYLLRPTDFHEIKASETLTLMNVSFLPEYADEKVYSALINTDRCYVGSVPPQSRPSFELSFGLMCREYEKPSLLSETYLKSLLNFLVVTVLRLSDGKQSLNAEPPVMRAIRYIQSEFPNNPSLNDVAAVAGFQSNYFCKIFKAATGKVYKDYLNDIKIDYAKRLLRASDCSITEICFASGYSSAAQFGREFFKRTNVSPRMYRA